MTHLLSDRTFGSIAGSNITTDGSIICLADSIEMTFNRTVKNELGLRVSVVPLSIFDNSSTRKNP